MGGFTYSFGFNFKGKLKQLFTYLFTGQTTTVDGTRYLVNQGEGEDAVMYTGQGAYSNGDDNELLVSGYIAQYIHWKDGVFTVTEINNTVTNYNLISSAGIYQWALLTDTTLTTTELSNIEQNPELALYWDNDVLMSDYFDVSKVFEWYPLTENVSAGGYYRNHALPMSENIISNGDFETGDFTGWDTSESASNWSVVNNQAVMSSTSVFTPIKYNTGFLNGESYVIEVDVIVLEGILKVQGGLTSNFNVEFTETGSYKFVITESYSGDINDGWIQFARNTGSTCSATIDNIKSYPLANSGLTPLTNWTNTTTTNAQQLTTGYQCALQELDSFGLPINHVTIDVKADSLADAQAQFLAENGLTLTDNAGTLEVYK